ncbi:signal peptidase I [Tannerella sp.]|uniref:signal peptidase I n=1 Tax=Tannerella sp. TaxID=2382127 RepID=UPI0026DD0A33|nr:signal peptidase I [Tannerella sp.]MDO4703630.1 signal peptidase I [Tannerella sp.]
MARRLIRYLTGLVIAALIALGLHLFCVGSYSISTRSMSDVLQEGDRVLVNKIRSDSNPGRGRIVLFRGHRTQGRQAPLFLSRCVGMPGDTVIVGEDGFRIGGRLYPNLPTTENMFRIRRNIKEPLMGLMRDLNIPYRSVGEDSLSLTFRLTSREELLLRDKLPQLPDIEWLPGERLRHTFVIPAKDSLYRIDSTSLLMCREAILAEYGNRASIVDGTLYVDGKPTRYLFFHKNYYWMLSDNEDEAVDSRHFGLIPETRIEGNVWFRWYSNDRKRWFQRIE